MTGEKMPSHHKKDSAPGGSQRQLRVGEIVRHAIADILSQGSVSMEGMAVTQEYFRVTGLHPLLGRTFEQADVTGKAPVILLGYNLWQRVFHGDPQVIGQTLRLSRAQTPPKVIGVMPPGVRFLPSPGNAQEPNYDVNAQVDYWVPAVPDPKRAKEPDWEVVGRLRNGVTLREAQADLALITARQGQAERDFAGVIPRLESLPAEMNRDGERILWPLLGAAGLVLLISCGNAGALLLVRGLQRQQEYAVRTALGQGRGALFAQVTRECLLLALAGAGLGILLAIGVVRIFKLIGGHAIPRLDTVTVGWPVLVCGLAVAVLSALLAGLFPAWRASGLDPGEALKSAGPKSSAGRGETRLLRAVTLAQTALTLALLAGAGLLIRTMLNLAQVDSGYDTTRILTMSVTAVQGDWATFHRNALERVARLPGVKNAAFAWGVPLTGNSWQGPVVIEGQPRAAKASDQLSLPLRAVTPGYFALLGLRLADGRDFRANDARNAPGVAIVNQTFVQRYFPRGTVVGKKIWINGLDRAPSQIVGVVADGRTNDLTQAAQPEIYLSLWQASAFSKHLVIRTTANPFSMRARIEQALHEVDPTAAVENVKTLEEIRGDSLAPRRFAMQLLVGFAVVGSVLTLIGIYGVISLSVAARRREIAIRAAVGARRQDIRKMVLNEGVRLIAGGVAAGVLAAWLLARVLRVFLFGVTANDPVTLISAGMLFTVVALLACWVPMERAASIEPLEALRYE